MKEDRSVWQRYKFVLIYGLSLAFLAFLLRWLELRFILFRHAFEIYAGLIALIFTGLGIWLALKLSKPKIETQVVEKKIYLTPGENFVPDSAQIDELAISKRELEILDLMARGHSNQEIASAIFVSLSTVKTHNRNIFEKLDVKRRTQAVERARQLGIIG